MIDTAFERHPVAQINHDRGLRNVEEQNGEQPKEKMRLSKFRRGPDPARANHKENLRQDQVSEAKWLLERATMLFDAALFAVDRDMHPKIVGHALRLPTLKPAGDAPALQHRFGQRSSCGLFGGAGSLRNSRCRTLPPA